MRDLLEQNRIPLVSNLMIRIQEETIYLHKDEIDRIMVNKSSHKTTTTGFVLGLCLDAVVAPVAVSIPSHF